MSFTPSQIAGDIAVSRAEDLRRAADRARLIRRAEAGTDPTPARSRALTARVRRLLVARAASRRPSVTAADCR